MIAGAAPPKESYLVYYADPNEDPYPTYEHVMAPFALNVEGAAPTHTPQQVSQEFRGNTGDPRAFIILEEQDGTNADNGRVTCYHRLTEYGARPHVAATVWDGRSFVFNGDVIHGQIPTYEWENLYFHLAAQVRVPEINEVDVMLAADPTAEMLGPFNVGDAGTELVRVRTSVYIPPPLVGAILTTPMTPRRAWTVLGGIIRGLDADTQNHCAPILNWLRVCLTREAIDRASTIRIEGPATPRSDAMLLRHTHNLLIKDLPGLDKTATHGADARLINTAITGVTDELEAARREKRDRQQAKEDDRLQRRFGYTALASLTNLCHVDDPDNLPPIYAEMAKAENKAQERQVLQNAIVERKRRAGVQFMVIVTPDLKK